MKLFNAIYILYLLCALIGCKQEPESLIDAQVSFQVKADYPTQLSLYYAVYTTDNFAEDRRINVEINQKNQWQTATFDFPMKVIPQQLMLKMGQDSLLRTIQIKNVVLKSQNKKVHLENADLNLFFLPDKYIKAVNPGNYKTFPMDGKFAPNVQSTPFYQQRLKIEF